MLAEAPVQGRGDAATVASEVACVRPSAAEEAVPPPRRPRGKARAQVALKLRSALDVSRAIDALRQSLPWLSVEDGLWLVTTLCFYVSGMWPAAHPSRAARQACAHPELCALEVDAERALARTVSIMLTGLEAKTT
ncbi:hypothetical protein [Myxococcus sp. SDU36]|uniref:hypothetical protein n=1 Tax=Myxococcus sp. SDU36 TaxID=2831967 RepID=UPI002542D81D|nr:hypothetical protein [Myxococcus sp. SDU36]